MEQFPDLNAEIPEIPGEFNDKAGLIVPDPNAPIDPIDQYVRPHFLFLFDLQAALPHPAVGLDFRLR